MAIMEWTTLDIAFLCQYKDKTVFHPTFDWSEKAHNKGKVLEKPFHNITVPKYWNSIYLCIWKTLVLQHLTNYGYSIN